MLFQKSYLIISLGESYTKNNNLCILGEKKKIFMENVDLGARNNPLKFPPKPCASSSVARFSRRKLFFCLYLDKYES